MDTYRLYRQSQNYHQSPAELFGVTDYKWLSWQFNNAVLMFGTWVENRLNETTKEGKRRYSFQQALGEPPKKVKTINVSQLAALGGVMVK